MKKHGKKATRVDEVELDALIEEITVDAYGDAEQLWAFRQAFEDNIALPSEGFVMGAPVSVIAFDFDGNERRGLTARCRGADGRKHTMSAADGSLEFPRLTNIVSTAPAGGPFAELLSGRHSGSPKRRVSYYLSVCRPLNLLCWRSAALARTPFGAGPECDHPRVRAPPNVGQSLFDPKDKTRGLVGGHARQWYGELCVYAHSLPGFADGDLWRSNGPIYVAQVFRNWQRAWLHTVSLCAVPILLACRSAERTEIEALFTDRRDIVPDELRRAFRDGVGNENARASGGYREGAKERCR